MMTDTRQLREAMLLRYYAAIDRGEADAFTQLFEHDVEIELVNEAAFRGADRFASMAAQRVNTRKASRHGVRAFHHDERQASLTIELAMEITRLDGVRVQFPVAAIARFSEAGKIASYRIFGDYAPLRDDMVPRSCRE